MSTSCRKLFILVGAVLIIAAILPPIAQDPRYHAFADNRTLHQIPNFWNVISNVPFFLAALYGLKVLQSGSFAEPWERFAFCILLAGTAAVGVGSTYYHLHPDDAHLFWDRLPMTVGFMSLLAATIAERIGSRSRQATSASIDPVGSRLSSSLALNWRP